MAKSADAFRTISEVADWLDTPAHVLRFWESKFTQVKPIKRAGGRRYYRPSDMVLIGGIKKLLHDDGLTIKGAQKILREQGVKHVAALSQPIDALLGEDLEHADLTPTEPAPVAEPVAETPSASSAPEPDIEHVDIEVESEDESAKVLQFQRSEDKTSSDKPTSPVAALLSEKASQDTAEEPETSEAEPTPAATADSDTKDDQTAADSDDTEAAPSDDKALPSFLHRSDAAPREDAGETPSAPAPNKVDVPADPSDDAFSPEAGLLAMLARARAPLPADQAREVVDLRDRLVALSGRMSDARKG